MNLLIVEDNRDIAENIADYLEPKGHQLDFATSGVIAAAKSHDAAAEVRHLANIRVSE